MKGSASAKQHNSSKSPSGGHSDKLEVTIIPVDEEPYSKMINIPSSMMGLANSGISGSGAVLNSGATLAGSQTISSLPTSSVQQQGQYPSLKDIFQAKENLWKPIFGSYVSQNKQPLFSIFRKKITIKADSKIPHPQGEEIGLHILFLKCDGNRFPRNAYANQLEVYCSTYFYGPLVIVYGELSPPYKLHSFVTSYLMDRIQPLNEEEQKIYPLPFSAKKCATVRNLMADRKFSCDLDQHEKQMSLEEFMIYSYKTSFCPYINKKHEWSECNYAHRQQDFRRPPHFYFYYLERCPFVTDDGNWDQCPEFLDCQYTHSLVEQLFSPLNYKLRLCPDRVPEQKFQCKKRLDLCCHNHSQEEKTMAITALKNPPKILPEHESMQDYIEIIDSEGLLTNQQKEADAEKAQAATALKPDSDKTTAIGVAADAGSTIQGQLATSIKKAALAKLPEENKDAWAMLEQAMNKQSKEKKDKDPVTESVPVTRTATAPLFQKSLSMNTDMISPVREVGVFPSTLNQIQNPMTPFNEFNTLEEEESPFLGKAKSSQFASNFMTQSNIGFTGQQLGQKSGTQEVDYVQQMMQANASNNTLGFGQNQNKNDNIVVKSERKSRKNQKKKIKVIESQIPDQKIQHEDLESLADQNNDNLLSVPEAEKASRKNSDVSEGDKSIFDQTSKNKSSQNVNFLTEQDATTSNILETDNSIHSDNEQVHIDETTSAHDNQSQKDLEGEKLLASEEYLKQNKKTMQLSKKYDDDLMKVKSILEEDIIEKIDIGASPTKESVAATAALNIKKSKKVNQPKQSQQDSGVIKSMAGTLLKQKIESKAESDSILKMADKYNQQSRFCMLQSSSSSSSEKDLAKDTMQKFSTSILDQDVPEEDIEVTQEEDQSSSGHKEEAVNEPDQQINSLFSFNFLNEEISPRSTNAKESSSNENQVEDEQIDSTKKNQTDQELSPEAQQAMVDAKNAQVNQSDEGGQNNFHNFFIANDQVFGSPSPQPFQSINSSSDASNENQKQGQSSPVRHQAQSTQTSQNVKVVNHFNTHQTINNYDIKHYEQYESTIKQQQFYNIQQANYNLKLNLMTPNVNNYHSQNYFVVINAPPQQYMNNGSNASSGTNGSKTQASSGSQSTTQQQANAQPNQQQTHQQFFAAYNQAQQQASSNGQQQPLDVFKLFGNSSSASNDVQSSPSTFNYQQTPAAGEPNQTQRSHGVSSTNSHDNNKSGDSNGASDMNQEDYNKSTKEVVLDMCNSVIMGSDSCAPTTSKSYSTKSVNVSHTNVNFHTDHQYGKQYQQKPTTQYQFQQKQYNTSSSSAPMYNQQNANQGGFNQSKKNQNIKLNQNPINQPNVMKGGPNQGHKFRGGNSNRANTQLQQQIPENNTDNRHAYMAKNHQQSEKWKDGKKQQKQYQAKQSM